MKLLDRFRSARDDQADVFSHDSDVILECHGIEVAYDKVMGQIRAQYSLGYASTNPAQDGRWRKVDIKLTRRDLRDARIQTRKGYFALYKEGQ